MGKKVFGSVALLIMMMSVFSCSSKVEVLDVAENVQSFTDFNEEAKTSESVTEVPTEPSTLSPKQVLKMPKDYELNGFGMLDVEPIMQLPELPTGCEVTSLAAALNYNGFYVTKEELADEYLTTADPFKATFDEAFILSPRMPEAYGCNSPVIKKAAEDYFKAIDADWSVYDLTGTDFKDLFYHIDEGRPVIVWASMWLMDVSYTLRWTTEDGQEAWFAEGEHCMTMKGYDLETDTVYVCDPLRGEIEYPISRFEEIYDQLGKQALVIYDREILYD